MRLRTSRSQLQFYAHKGPFLTVHLSNGHACIKKRMSDHAWRESTQAMDIGRKRANRSFNYSHLEDLVDGW